MLEDSFVAKANSFKLRPFLLYLKGLFNVKNVPWLIDTWATQSVMNMKLTKVLGLPMRSAGKPINVQFAKSKLHETKEVALNVTFKCGTLDFVESFSLCEMDEMDLLLGDTFFETHTVDVKRKPVRLVVCRDGKELSLKLTRYHLAGGGKLNLVSMDQLSNVEMVVVIRMEQLQGTHGDAGMVSFPQSILASCWGGVGEGQAKCSSTPTHSTTK